MNSNLDIRSARRLLREIADLSEQASLTGSLSSGANRAARRYNSILSGLIESGTVPEELFTLLPEDVSFGEVGVEARMLASYLKEDRERPEGNGDDQNILLRLAPFVDQKDLSELVRQHMQGSARLDMNILTHLAPFLAKEDLSSLLRLHLRPERPQAPTPPHPPVPPTAPSQRREEWPRVPEVTQMGDFPPAAPRPSLHELLGRLKNPMISDQERAELIEQVQSQFPE